MEENARDMLSHATSLELPSEVLLLRRTCSFSEYFEPRTSDPHLVIRGVKVRKYTL